MSCSLEFSVEFFLFNRTDIFSHTLNFIIYLESPVSPKTLNVKLYEEKFYICSGVDP